MASSKAVRLRPKTRAREGERPRAAVFTAIDATLLDASTFSAGRARDVIRKLVGRGVAIVPVSVMTLDEIVPLARELGLEGPMIIEGGNAIARLEDGAWSVEPCGPPAETYLDVIRAIEDRSGASLLMYSALPDRDAERASGRSGGMLDASRHRLFSEPFLLESGDLKAVARAAGELGYAVRQGRRFLHLCRECDQGEAFRRIAEELGCDKTIAVGGSEVDAEFMRLASIAVAIPDAAGNHDRTLVRRVPGVRLAAEPAPLGWASAVEDACHTILSPSRHNRADRNALSA